VFSVFLVPRRMNEELATRIGSAAREARMQLGLTQAEVAEKLGLAHMVYNRLERGKMLPSVSTLLRLCAVLRISSDALLGLEDPEAGAKSGKGERGQGEGARMRQLTGLARKMDEDQLDALVKVAQVLLR
jgi:transcriptional regulator with XRE-family HTH domain